MGLTKQYLGDGVYVLWDGCHLVVTTEDGVETTNTVYLEPAVYNALVQYAEQLRQLIARDQLKT